MPSSLNRVSWLCLGLILSIPGYAAQAAGNYSLSQAVESISVRDIKEHVKVLASDTFEGREAGSQGGRAAGIYLGQQYQQYKLAGGAEQNQYYQEFSGQYRNILGLVRGTDPKLRDEVIVVSAHYDHVGYGNSENSRGPTGYIHNGADDNASGTAALVEVAQAISQLQISPRRTILFALWDAEEKGLWGSQHWAASPTVPRQKIKLLINVDMIGRLRNGALICYGTRTCRGLRQLVSTHNHDANLKLDYTWELPDNSDHWPFVLKQIPVLMFHTGLHPEYHTPNDDLDKLNYDGTCEVARLMFEVTWDLANRDEIAPFRRAAPAETIAKQREVERGLPPRSGRLGIRWTELKQPQSGVRIDHVHSGSAAQQAGLQTGDRIHEIAGQPINSGAQFMTAVLAATAPAEFVITRGEAEDRTAVPVNLTGSPVRLGISWRTDDADPGALVLTRIIPGSAAAGAGLQLNDRIYKIAEQPIADAGKLQPGVFFRDSKLKLLVERQGYLRTVEIDLSQLPEQG